ncbi:MAG: hypothetical protein M0Q02_11160, partial [Candidatus Muirbacterium halophilum]|nr:hypothetical protein [Candidatus Muirbacterium halophilum]
MNNLIIVGSGASFDLNLPTTRDIDYILFILLDYNNDDIYENPLSIEERIKKFDDLTPIKKLKKAGLYEAFKNNIVDLLMILKDGDGETDESVFLKKRENYIKEYVEKHYKNLGISPTDKKKEIYKNYIEELPIKYDWLALKSICHEIKNKLPSQKDNRLQTLLTELEFSRLRGISVFARNLFKDSYETRKLFENDPSRLNSAINVYNIFLYKIFKHFIMLAEEKDIQTYVDFYKKILMKNEFKPGTGMADSEKYCHKTSFATYNWDPFLPYFLMKANYELNQEYKKVCNKDNILTKSFIDFSYPFPIVKLSGDHVEKT